MAIESLAHYRIIEQIGEGGMGVVYKAHDSHLDRPVALKVLRGEGLADPDRQRRFVAEARAASALSHPNIVTVHDVSQDRGIVFIVMEYLDGRTLSKTIGPKGMHVADAIRIATQVASALERAHGAGIVHRDLKPGNIMVTSGGAVKVLDFGLAKLLRPEHPPPDSVTRSVQPMTADGAILGTVAYMSPEQAAGDTVDERSDIFAFGAVLYEMLTGDPAFARESQVSTLTAVMRDMPVPISERVDGVPAELDRIVGMCLQKDPGRRFQHASDIRVLLERLKEDTDSGRKPRPSAPAQPRRGRRRRAVTAAIVAVAALAASGAAWFWYTRRPLAEVRELTQTGFTFDDGLTFLPAVSPDGSLVAFASDRSGEGHLDIYVQQAPGAQATRRTTDPADDSQPAFSPDGSKIVFRSERGGGGIYVMDALAGTERKVAARGTHPRFSPDGSRIGFIDPPAAAISTVGNRLAVVAADGGQPVALHPDFVASGGMPNLDWSPDGKYLLAHGYTRSMPRGDVFAVPLDGGPPVATGLAEVAQPYPGAAFYPCAWTAGGIVYAVSGSVDGSRLFLAPAPGPDMRIKGHPRLLLSTGDMLYGAATSGSGRLLYSLLNWTPNYWKVALDPRRGAAIGAPARMTSDTSMKLDAAISRDGSRMAYVSLFSRRDQRIDLRIQDLPSGGETRLPLTGRFQGNFTLRLSVDGALVAFRDWDGKKFVTYLARTDGSAKTVLCDDCTMLHFGSQPGVVFFMTADTLVRRETDRRSDQRLLDIPAERISDAAVSPDEGAVAVLLENPDRTADIGIASLSHVPVTVPDLSLVAHDDRYLASPRWSSDGGLLYYLSQRDGFMCIWAQRVDPRTRTAAGAPFPVLHQHQMRLGRFGPRNIFSFEIGGTMLLMNLTETRGNIWTAR